MVLLFCLWFNVFHLIVSLIGLNSGSELLITYVVLWYLCCIVVMFVQFLNHHYCGSRSNKNDIEVCIVLLRTIRFFLYQTKFKIYKNIFRSIFQIWNLLFFCLTFFSFETNSCFEHLYQLLICIISTCH